MLLVSSKSITSRLSPLSSSAFTSSIYRLFSTPPPQENPSASLSPASDFAVQYLIRSCGLPLDKATKASRYITHLKSPEKPDAVLRFLRQVGVSEPHIKSAALRGPQFLCRDVEKVLQPRIAELQEIGFSPSDISFLLSICPRAFSCTKLKQKFLFWLEIFNSVEELLSVLKNNSGLVSVGLKRISANLAFLRDECGLSNCQIVRLMKSIPRFITYKIEAVKEKADKAQELGIRHSSGMFLYALIVVSSWKQSNIDARINNLRNIGFSQEEVTSCVRKLPPILAITEVTMIRKMEFLTKEADCDKAHLVKHPFLFTLSLEKRLIPRNLVRKILKLKGFSVANQKLFSFMKQTEKKFVEKFVVPYEPAIPGLRRAYEDACAGNTGGLECLKSNLS